MDSVLVLGTTTPVGMAVAEVLALNGFRILSADMGDTANQVESALAELDHRLCQNELHRYQALETNFSTQQCVDWAFGECAPKALVCLPRFCSTELVLDFGERAAAANEAASDLRVLLVTPDSSLNNEWLAEAARALQGVGVNLNVLLHPALHIEELAFDGTAPPRASTHVRTHPVLPTPHDVGVTVDWLLQRPGRWLSGSQLRMATRELPKTFLAK